MSWRGFTQTVQLVQAGVGALPDHAWGDGVPLTAVGALLGHESLQSTARYTQPSPKDLRDAVQTLALEEER